MLLVLIALVAITVFVVTVFFFFKSKQNCSHFSDLPAFISTTTNKALLKLRSTSKTITKIA